MKKILLTSAAALLLFAAAACSDSTDSTTTESIQQPDVQQTAPMEPATPGMAPATGDNNTTQGVTPSPESGSGGTIPLNAPNATGTDQPAPAQ